MAGRQTSPDKRPDSDEESERAAELQESKAAAARAQRQKEAEPSQVNPGDAQNALTRNDNPTAPGQSGGSGGTQQGQPFQAAGGEVPTPEEEPGGRGRDDGRQSDEGGSEDPVERAQKLAEEKAQAGAAAQAAAGAAASGDVEEKIQEQTNSINHYLVVQFLPTLFGFDASCFFLTTIFTIPIYYLIIGVLLGLELKSAMTGSKSMIPYFPKLTWASFAPPGTMISLPLPDMVLYMIVFWAILMLNIATVIWAGLIYMFVLAVTDPGSAFQFASMLFHFFVQ